MGQDAINPNGIVDEECGTTALMQAAEEGDLDEVRMLLRAGGKPVVVATLPSMTIGDRSGRLRRPLDISR